MEDADRGVAGFVREKVRWGQRAWAWLRELRPYRAFSHFTNVGGSVLTGGMAYLAIFAVFAAVALGFGAFGIELRGRPELYATLVEHINGLVPGLIATDGHAGAVDVSTLLTRSALNWTTVLAGGSLLWAAMSWFTGTRRSIRIIFGLDVKEYRNYWLLKLRDLALAGAFGLALLISAVLTVASSRVFDGLFSWLGWNEDNWLLGGLGQVLRLGAMVLFDFLLLISIHRFLAEVKVRWRALMVGCLLGAIVMGGIKLLGTSLLDGATRNPLFATFVVVIGLLIWFNLLCRVMLLTSSWIATGLDRKLGSPHEV